MSCCVKHIRRHGDAEREFFMYKSKKEQATKLHRNIKIRIDNALDYIQKPLVFLQCFDIDGSFCIYFLVSWA